MEGVLASKVAEPRGCRQGGTARWDCLQWENRAVIMAFLAAVLFSIAPKRLESARKGPHGRLGRSRHRLRIIEHWKFRRHNINDELLLCFSIYIWDAGAFENVRKDGENRRIADSISGVPCVATPSSEVKRRTPP